MPGGENLGRGEACMAVVMALMSIGRAIVIVGIYQLVLSGEGLHAAHIAIVGRRVGYEENQHCR